MVFLVVVLEVSTPHTVTGPSASAIVSTHFVSEPCMQQDRPDPLIIGPRGAGS